MQRRAHAEDHSRGRHAVVIGGSMAGLLAARVLSEHFDAVTVVERDAIPDDLTGPRKGVPQGHQLHVLLAKGQEILGSLFPDLVPSLIADGAVPIDVARDVAWFHYGVWKQRFESNLEMVCMTRPLLEAHVRRRVFARSNVRRLDRARVTGLRLSDDRTCVSGVTVERLGDEPAAAPELLDAEMVVEARGRGSPLPGWLESLGYGRPEETTIKTQVGYVSRAYRRRHDSPWPWKGVFVVGTPPESKRLGAAMPIEGDRWMVTFAGVLGDHPPTDPDGMMAFARSLPRDELCQVLRLAEPIGEGASCKFPANVRHHYDRLDRFPEGLIVVGDALVSFNPMYGQGMTTAALHAVALDRALGGQVRRRSGDIRGVSRRYLMEAAKAADGPWSMTLAEDLRHPEIEGRRPRLFPISKWYFEQVHRAASIDTEVYGHFLRAMHMVASPGILFDPRVVLRVMRAAHARRNAPTSATPAAPSAGPMTLEPRRPAN